MALDPALWGLISGGLATGVSALARPWLRRGGHRIAEDLEFLGGPPRDGITSAAGAVSSGAAGGIPGPPRARWLLPATLTLGYAVGWARAGQGTSAAVIVTMGLLVGLLGVLSVIDLDVHRLPNMFTYPLAGAVLVVLTAVALATGEWPVWRRALLAGLVLGVFYLALVVLGRGSGMGLGDAKLAPTLGMLLGHLSWGSVLLGTMLTFLLGGVAAGVLLVLRRVSAKTAIPFGPAMALGAVLLWAWPGVVAL